MDWWVPGCVMSEGTLLPSWRRIRVCGCCPTIPSPPFCGPQTEPSSVVEPMAPLSSALTRATDRPRQMPAQSLSLSPSPGPCPEQAQCASSGYAFPASASWKPSPAPAVSCRLLTVKATCSSWRSRHRAGSSAPPSEGVPLRSVPPSRRHRARRRRRRLAVGGGRGASAGGRPGSASRGPVRDVLLGRPRVGARDRARHALQLRAHAPGVRPRLRRRGPLQHRRRRARGGRAHDDERRRLRERGAPDRDAARGHLRARLRGRRRSQVQAPRSLP